MRTSGSLQLVLISAVILSLRSQPGTFSSRLVSHHSLSHMFSSHHLVPRLPLIFSSARSHVFPRLLSGLCCLVPLDPVSFVSSFFLFYIFIFFYFSKICSLKFSFLFFSTALSLPFMFALTLFIFWCNCCRTNLTITHTHTQSIPPVAQTLSLYFATPPVCSTKQIKTNAMSYR